MVFANIEAGLQQIGNRQNESKPKRHKKAEKTVNPMETQSISAVRKGTPWVVFENVSIILKHAVIFGLLNTRKDVPF